MAVPPNVPENTALILPHRGKENYEWMSTDDLLTYMVFATEHWSRLDPTNPLERLNPEVKRRTDVVDVFPDDPAQVWEHDTRGGAYLMYTTDRDLNASAAR
jgi:hypothetical protein